jgi:hypothetical protein
VRKLGLEKLLTYDNKRELLQRYREGENMAELALRFGITRQGVWHFLKTRKEPIRPRHAKQYNAYTGPKPDGWTVAQRDEAGIIVTLRRQDTGELHAMHIPGKKDEALRHMAALIDRSGVDWRLLCYSSKQTIEGDLAKRRVVRTKPGMPAQLVAIEAMALGRIRRKDLLDPSVALGDARKKRGGLEE